MKTAQTTIQPGQFYKHFKGNRYKILNIAKSSDNLEWYVVYEALYPNPEGQIWIRSLKEFSENVDVQGKNISRFTLD